MPEQQVNVTRGVVGTFNDLYLQLEEEIRKIQCGEMDDKQARANVAHRKVQVKLIELSLQAVRLRGNSRDRLRLLPEPPPIEVKKTKRRK